MGLQLTKRVSDYLKERPGERFTARQLAEWIMDAYPQDCEAKMNRSKAQTIPIDSKNALRGQIIAEIGSYRKNLAKNDVVATSERPRQYYYEAGSYQGEEFVSKESVRVVSEGEGTAQNEIISVHEGNLYPIALEFLRTERGVLGKRINEGRSSNRRGPRGNRWLYPDLVGMEDLSSDWNDEIKRYVFETGEKAVKLWSVEVKLEINRSDVREYFFQAVSNSSWANVGYLAALDIKDSALEELRILSALHGIGFIKLDYETPSESQIIIPARERVDVDWSVASRLADENTDFEEYIRAVQLFCKTEGKSVNMADWDTPEIEDD